MRACYLDELIGLQGGGSVQDDLAVLNVILKRDCVDLFEWHELLQDQMTRKGQIKTIGWFYKLTIS